ncbi:hypothetical protein [Streptomyces sp. NPDC018972]|uniref:hypothetical protein n=1 Tax=Streptomyces sp. NPDC018972 TaxID=3365060 RepID=UPI00379E0389
MDHTAATALVTVAGAVSVGLSGSLQPDGTVLGGSLTLSVVALMVAGAVGAVTTVIAVLLLPSPLGPLLGDLQRRLTGVAPTAAPEKLTQMSDATPDTVGTLGPWPSLTLVTVYMALALTGAGSAPGGRTVRTPVPPPPRRRARCLRGRTAG